MLALSDFGTGAHGRFLTGVESDLASAMTTLTDGSTVVWNCDNRKLPMAKLTSSQSFTIDMTNVISGAQGVLKLITNTASAITLTFDVSFTNETLNTTITTYTFPALTAQEYFLSFVVDGTTIANVRPYAYVQRSANQAVADSTFVAVSFDTEITDNASIYSAGAPTRFTIPGAGNKLATVAGYISFAVSTTGVRRVFVYKGGVTTNVAFAQLAGVATVGTIVSFSFQVQCAAGDYLELMAWQNSTGSLNVTSYCTIKIEDR
jgi:hypothetical protein